MLTIIRLSGVLGIVGGIGCLIVAILSASDGLLYATAGAGGILSGALLLCFATIADTLSVIRELNEKQLAALTERSR